MHKEHYVRSLLFTVGSGKNPDSSTSGTTTVIPALVTPNIKSLEPHKYKHTNTAAITSILFFRNNIYENLC